MSTLTWSEIRHNAFFDKMREENVVIDETGSVLAHSRYVAYFKDQEDGLHEFGHSPEDAYLGLMELVEDSK